MIIELSEPELRTVIHSLQLAADRYRENTTMLSVPNSTQSDAVDSLLLAFSHQEQNARKLVSRLENEQATESNNERDEAVEDLERTIET